MARGRPGSWVNACQGAGLQGPVAREELRELINFYESHGIEPRIEVCPLGHRSLIEVLAAERFVTRQFETTFFRPLAPRVRVEPLHPPPDGFRIERLRPDDRTMADEYTKVAVHCFLPSVARLPDGYVESIHRALSHPRTIAILGTIEAKVVAVGGMEVIGKLAAAWGVAVLEPWRRRGIQQAMLAWRLNHAVDRGATLATISSRPGVPTARNARRLGFQVAYTKSVMVRPGPGLAPVVD
jgi:GNAT superfamily N-acetyltransferase